MYVKLNNGIIETYPYTIGDLRKDNPNISFPKVIPDNILTQFDVFTVVATSKPEDVFNKNVSEDTPDLVDGQWTQRWTVVDATSEEIAQRLANQWTSVRSERNERLAATDWTQIYDAPVEPMAWTGYRQALRDITTQADPFNIVWPVAPSA